MKRIFLTISALLAATLCIAQKPPIDHSVYDSWKRINDFNAPFNGRWVMYSVVPEEGDCIAVFYDALTGRKIEVPRGVNASITENQDYAVVTVKQEYAKARKARIEKQKEDKVSKDTLKIISLTGGKDTCFAGLKTFKTLGMPFSRFILFSTQRPDSLPKARCLLDLRTMKIDTLKNAVEVLSTEDSRYAAVIRGIDKKDSLSKNSISIMDLSSGVSRELASAGKDTTFQDASFTQNGYSMFFNKAMKDTVSKKESTSIFYYESPKASGKKASGFEFEGAPRLLVDDSDPAFGGKVRIAGPAAYNDDASFADFPVKVVYPEADTTLPEFERPKLDIWSWDADYNQSYQKISMSDAKDTKYGWRIALNAAPAVARPFRIEDDTLEKVFSYRTNKSGKVLALSDKPYRIAVQWDENPHVDFYIVDMKTGAREKVLEDVSATLAIPSPDCTKYAYFDMKAGNWYVFDMATRDTVDVTKSIGLPMYNEEHDQPMYASAYDGCHWLEDSKKLLVRDRYDWWIISVDGSAAPTMLTEGAGRAAKTQLSISLPYWRAKSRPEENFFNFRRPLYFLGLNKVTKEHSIWMKDMSARKPQLRKLVEGPYTYSEPVLSFAKPMQGAAGSVKPRKDSEPLVFFTEQNFEHCPNIHYTADLFKTERRITDINPQQKNYNWGTAELVHWKAADGTPVDGILCKPEDFDPSKKYPMIVYFYELYSDELYTYRTPAPIRSTVNWSYYASNGYLVFIPDIRYKVGHPGQSALDYIMPGCDMLCRNSWVDSTKMAIQGQSWGGYQVAYMITRTGRFAAAGAGAPVSNMTSAYGGIRLESGSVREMQYEGSQSRIGKTLWDGFDLYVENSPLFGVPNVTTPVLIMHNDADGAVPWQQGIEFFTALRRCGKKAWLLEYNDEAHNLMQRKNCRDLTVRMSQFFGHYLKGEPAPKWMTEGIPYTMKGIDYGYGVPMSEAFGEKTETE